MPKNIPFYKLCERAKRKRLHTEDNESNSTDSSSDYDPSYIQQLHTSAITHNIEQPNSSQHSNYKSFLCNEFEFSDNSSDHSKHSELFEQSDYEYWGNNDHRENDILLENIDLDSSSDPCSPSASSNSSQCNENLVSSNTKVLKFLKSWALKHNITHSALSDLLAGLKKNHECFADESETKFPINARTLLMTKLKLVTKVIDSTGYYIHFRLKRQLLKLAPKYLRNVSTFKLLVNIDRLPLYKSSSDQVYPILCTIVSITELRNKVIPIGIYYGKDKPKNLNNYLLDFIIEVSNIIEHGLHFENYTTILDGVYFVCDAPAKSYILGIVSHTGYYSCTRCTVRGITSDYRRIFPDLESSARSNEDFIEWRDSNFRRRSTPLVNIVGLHFVHHFILDYLHLECLDVMRTMILNIWYKGPIPHRLTAAHIEKLNFDNLLDILKHFVQSTEILYHKNFISHNFHNNIHVTDDADYFVDKLVDFSLHTISAFPFENYMQTIKRKIRGRKNPLEQIGRRIEEIMTFESDNSIEKVQDDIFPKLFFPHNAGPVLSGCRRQYRGAILPLFKITNKVPDNCCGTDSGVIIQVENVAFSDNLHVPVIIGREFVNKCDFYNAPIESSRVGIFKVKQLSNLKIWPLSQITVKYVQFPYKNFYIVSSMLHCDTP
ncbi:hypothetical protein ALC62_08503 [Cyphomyrmex costatus]|uniref:Transposase domain-containing protein n=1 Tax=Cyphomyrmex costatus TaxID=456900 RepID=A0A151IGX7_9HYME|nr:hypothetical protein ALC62_08503 [Cyphomyrmex costatus]